MSSDDVNREHFQQMWSEICALVSAWQDRHDLDVYGAAGIFLQYGTSIAHESGFDLDKILDLIRKHWALLEKHAAEKQQ